MKKRRLKKWVKVTIILMLLFVTSILFIEVANKRANQINRSMGYVETN